MFSGYNSGYNNTVGTKNVMSGYQCGYNNDTGFSNVMSGYQSGYTNDAGNYNVFSGYQSGYSNTMGTNNVFSGASSGAANTTGNGNVFSGYQSGIFNTTGTNNVFSGYQSGYLNYDGIGNVFSGYKSGFDNDAGNYNTALGHLAGPGSGFRNLTNTTTLGNRASVSVSNALILGGTGANAVSVGIGTSAPRGLFDVDGPGDTYLVNDPNNGTAQSVFLPGHLLLAPYSGTSGTAYVQARVPAPTATTSIGLTFRTSNGLALVDALRLNANGSAVFVGSVTATTFTPSDARLKEHIRPLGGALAAVRALRGVRYTYRQNLPGHPLPQGEQVGVLAQEVEALYPELVTTGADGYKAVNYAQLAPVLIEALKELATRNAVLETRNTALETKVEADHADLQTMKQQLARLLGNTQQGEAAPAGTQARR